ncbi:uncharacterized protein LOC130815681 [Amaranthus tricolor]|uniref:uncharacterized protein LOC130815681 n=1 Tax=Amaranthus tricolor TaxID=29722 RepID=UPI00258F4C52|nr:uncharacterized protein LOC130815681 [Amaranthus tricolor]
MYDRVSTNIHTPVSITEFFPIKVGLHRGSSLGPFIFTVIMEKISKSIWETVPWCMLFADNIVLVVETKEEANSKLEEWRAVLEDRGLRISRRKTEYLQCDFSGTEPIGEPEVTIGGEVVTCTSKFKYLRSAIQSNGEIDGDVTYRIQADWLEWRAATNMLCDKKFPSRLKGKFYRVAIRPTLLYETECWPVKKVFKQRIEVTEMRMLRWMCGHTITNRIRNQKFREKLEGKTYDALVRRIETIIVEGFLVSCGIDLSLQLEFSA